MRLGIAVSGLAIAAFLCWLLWPNETAPPVSRGPEASIGEAPPELAPDDGDDIGQQSPWGPGKRPSPEQARAWRDRMRKLREEWEALSPEERQQRMAARAERMVTIEAIGETAPDLEPVDLMGPIRAIGRDIHECVEEKGGWHQFWTAARALVADAGPGGMRAPRVSFEVDPDGTLRPESLVLEPPPPEGYSECFEDAWGAVTLPAPNAAARVEVRFGPPPGRRPGTAGDAPGSSSSVMNRTR